MQAPADPVSEYTTNRAFVHARPGLDVSQIIAARKRLAGHVANTPCDVSNELTVESGCAGLYLKRDHLQRTGSFKERGAANALLTMSVEARGSGVVAASAGNHALGLARHGARLGVPVTLIMPRAAARTKVERCRALGADVVLEGGSFEDAEAFARKLAESRDATFVHPFDDDAVIAGQGTMALEILEQVPDLGAIVVPVGGGGLLAGVATVVKALRPDVWVAAVEPVGAACFAAALRGGEPVGVAVGATLADGLAVARVGSRPLELTRGLVDAAVTVSEEEIAWAMLRLFEAERTTVEGAGATALAALLAGALPGLADRKVVVPVCGGNVDADTFVRGLRLGLGCREGFNSIAQAHA